MKSLKESLFDKDLIEKDLPSFGSKFEVHCVLVSDDAYEMGGLSSQATDYNWLSNTFKLGLLKRDIKHPIKINNTKKDTIDGEYVWGWRADAKVCDAVGYIVSILNKQLLDNTQFNIIIPINKDILQKDLSPYLKNMDGNTMRGTGGNYYFSKGGDGTFRFTIQRKDKRIIIVFDKK